MKAILKMVALAALLSPQIASAQSSEKIGETEATYRTLLALIDEMVGNGLLTRARADALIARARQGAAVQLAQQAPAPSASPPVAAPSTTARQEGAVSRRAIEMEPPRQGIEFAARQPDVPADLKVDWSRGAPVFTSRNGAFSFKPRGRILADVQTTNGSNADARNITTSTLRQFRVGAQGTIGANLFYQFETDFRRNQTEVVNTFVGYRKRFGEVEADVRAGSLLTDRGIDVATAAQSNPFITLNVNSLALAPNGGIFLMGLAGRASGPNWHASVAVHGDRIDADTGRNDNRILLARAHWNPVVWTNGAMHLGGWIYDEAMPGRNATVTVNTLMAGAISGNVRVDSAELTGVDGSSAFGAELGIFRGPLYAYGEYGERRLERGPAATFGDATYKATSISGGWWITGETVPYQTRSGTMIAPRVTKPMMGDGGGWGALELVGRYEHVDYSDVPSGGTGTTWTLGLNWHLTNYFRLMADYSRWQTGNVIGVAPGRDTGDTLSARAEVSF
ncbi:MAG: porin [Sphingomonas hengshuiensis]|uniref:Porin n=1 Tax=Sphingomonas hengshuiensis TaxID=1609977 RepID=A0A2W4ZF38_9SPHN|nr:MAG: porin [Sphingomonas hengshuiensis]